MGGRLVPVLRCADRRGAGVQQRLLFPAVLAMMTHRMIDFIVSIMSYRLQTPLHHVKAKPAAKETQILDRGAERTDTFRAMASTSLAEIQTASAARHLYKTSQLV